MTLISELGTDKRPSFLSNELVSSVDVFGATDNALDLVDALVFGEDAKQRTQLQPPVVERDAMSVKR
jgi:hypothetical protein